MAFGRSCPFLSLWSVSSCIATGTFWLSFVARHAWWLATAAALDQVTLRAIHVKPNPMWSRRWSLSAHSTSSQGRQAASTIYSYTLPLISHSLMLNTTLQCSSHFSTFAPTRSSMLPSLIQLDAPWPDWFLARGHNQLAKASRSTKLVALTNVTTRTFHETNWNWFQCLVFSFCVSGTVRTVLEASC